MTTPIDRTVSSSLNSRIQVFWRCAICPNPFRTLRMQTYNDYATLVAPADQAGDIDRAALDISATVAAGNLETVVTFKSPSIWGRRWPVLEEGSSTS